VELNIPSYFFPSLINFLHISCLKNIKVNRVNVKVLFCNLDPFFSRSVSYS
jgi:hypothetical protein